MIILPRVAPARAGMLFYGCLSKFMYSVVVYRARSRVAIRRPMPTLTLPYARRVLLRDCLHSYAAEAISASRDSRREALRQPPHQRGRPPSSYWREALDLRTPRRARHRSM
jgi:hypothetical protein